MNNKVAFRHAAARCASIKHHAVCLTQQILTLLSWMPVLQTLFPVFICGVDNISDLLGTMKDRDGEHAGDGDFKR
jgi:hypothetical protein